MGPNDPVLFGYWRSTAAYRVRIALNLKGVGARHAFVHLRNAEQHGAGHRARSPADLVPVWCEADGFNLTQSLAIIAYLDEIHPDPALLPGDARMRAAVREIALMVAADTHPLHNLRVVDELTARFGADALVRADWVRHWIGLGFAAVERRLERTTGRFSVGDAPTLADVCLVPQAYAARRFELDLSPFPRISVVAAAAESHPAFAAARPDVQPDAE